MFKGLGDAIETLPMHYWGLLLMRGRPRATDWQPVIAKVKWRLEGWQTRLLSRRGGWERTTGVVAVSAPYDPYVLPFGT